jgi:phage baseplate assembly protein W
MARATYSDFDIELPRQTDGDVQRDTDINAILNSLQNIVSTLQGSRRMLPEFAQDIHSLLFEPITDESARAVGNTLLEGIRTWEDRVEVIGIDIEPKHDMNQYRIRMEFIIKPLEQEQIIDFVLFAQ